MPAFGQPNSQLTDGSLTLISCLSLYSSIDFVLSVCFGIFFCPPRCISIPDILFIYLFIYLFHSPRHTMKTKKGKTRGVARGPQKPHGLYEEVPS